MSEQISIEKLASLLRDPDVDPEDLKQYVRLSETSHRPLSRTLVVSPQTVKSDEMVAQGDTIIGYLNDAWAARRQERYRRTIANGWSGPRLVAEGDSWFQYPLGSSDDLIDYLMADHAIFCMAAGGDTLAEMINGISLLEQRIFQEGATGLLLSAGGNDLAGRDLIDASGHAGLARFLREDHPSHPNPPPEFYISTRFANFLDGIVEDYRAVVDRLLMRFPNLKIFVHGYDRPYPLADGTWLGPALASFDIGPQYWRDIVSIMINRFNDALSILAACYPNVVYYVDCRGAVGAKSGWRDEMHAHSSGCQRAAARFQSVISRTLVPIV